MKNEVITTRMNSPLGLLEISASSRGLCSIRWHSERVSESDETPTHPVLRQARLQLQEYFEGRRSDFDLPIDVEGTEFQMKVWRSLRTIPYGRTWSYGDLARSVGNPKASRAVGMANGRNPLPIVVPCHRVIGANGKLTGFSGGLQAKEILLGIEKKGT